MHSYCTKLFYWKILLCLRKESLHIPTLFVDFLSTPTFLGPTPVPCSRIPGVVQSLTAIKLMFLQAIYKHSVRFGF
jgi:hypothetical protein